MEFGAHLACNYTSEILMLHWDSSVRLLTSAYGENSGPMFFLPSILTEVYVGEEIEIEHVRE